MTWLILRIKMICQGKAVTPKQTTIIKLPKNVRAFLCCLNLWYCDRFCSFETAAEANNSFLSLFCLTSIQHIFSSTPQTEERLE